MTDLETGLRHLVDEGTRVAHRPPPAVLRGRLRRRRSVTTAAVAVAVLAIALPVAGSLARVEPAAVPPGVGASAAAGPSGDTVDVRPAVVGRGRPVAVSGAGCRPGEAVTFTLPKELYRHDLGTATADRYGAFSATITIPADAPPGTTTLWSACRAPNPAGKLALPATIEIT
jgi:hypothetical protein